MLTRTLILSSLFLLLISSFQKTQNSLQEETAHLKIPPVRVDKSSLRYENTTSHWLKDGEPFSGHAVSYYTDGRLKQQFGVLNGKKEFETIDWYADGHVKFVAYYHRGKLHGGKKRWSADSTHSLVAHFNFYNGKAHGEQKRWYSTGELFKIQRLNMGIEEGLQQAFRKNGDLYTNYEARNGRIFGLKKTKLCFELEDEEVQYDE